MRAGISSSGTLSSADAALRAEPVCSAALRAALPVSASMRRTPAATPQSRQHRDQADVAGAPHMRAAAQLDRPAHACCRPPSPIATTRTSSPYFSPNSARAPEATRVVERHQPRGDGRVLQHDVVGDVLDPLELVGRHRLGMREVEAQPVGRDQRALLRDVIAEHLAQRLVQQMRGGMVAADAPSGARDRPRAAARSPTLSVPCSTLTMMREQVAGLLLRVGDARRARRRAVIVAGVADLAAGLAVERRLVEHHRAALAGFQLGDLLAVAAPARRRRLRRSRSRSRGTRSAPSFSRSANQTVSVRGLARARPGGARLGALALHRVVEAHARSTPMPRARSASCVRSSGKP